MIVTYTRERPGPFSLTIRPDADDRSRLANGASLRRKQASFWMPASWHDDDVHPDLLALAVLLCVQPFTGSTLQVSRAVSPAFHAAVAESFGINVGPVDDALESRRAPAAGVPGLSFSGGVDSTAAIEALPPETVSVFLDRVSSSAELTRSLYRPEAARAACRTLAERGHRVMMVATDLEHLRSPVGFPTDLAAAAPLVLLADLAGLDAVSWGTIAESAYRVGHQRFADYYERPAYKPWATVFAAVGLPVLNPLAGVSEVGTSRIVRERGWRDVAQSCIRGVVGAPCLNCWKCFRKSLLDAALADDWPSNDHIDRLFRIPEAQRQLSKVPIKHENVVAFLLGRYEGSHPEMLALKRRVQLAAGDVEYLERWYGPSSEPWPTRYRDDVVERLDGLLGRMSGEEERQFRGWDLSLLRSGREERIASAYGALLLSTNAVVRRPGGNHGPSPSARGVDPGEELQKRTTALRAEIDAVEQSASYRLGRYLEGVAVTRRAQ